MRKALLVEVLESAAKAHDWYYESADLLMDWRNGWEQRQRIENAYRALWVVDRALAVETWNRVAPELFQLVE